MRKSSVVILFVVFALTGCSQFTVSTPEHWSDSLVLKETHFTENRTVEDKESAATLFTYHMYPTAQPVDVQKIDAHHWLAVFEQPDPLLKSRVRVERISDVEFRVVLEPAPARDKREVTGFGKQMKMRGLKYIAIGSWVAVLLSFGTITGSAQKEALLSFCQLSLSERLKHANLSFTDGFVFKVDKNGKPVEIRRIFGKWVDDQEVISCVSKWQFSGFEEDRRFIVTFGWKHGVGWAGMRVVSKDFSQVITNGRATVPDCTKEAPGERSWVGPDRPDHALAYARASARQPGLALMQAGMPAFQSADEGYWVPTKVFVP